VGKTALTDQIIKEVKSQSDELNRLQYGEVILKVQNGKLIMGDIRKTWKCGAGSKNERSQA
jgi:hypothetical protein